MITKQELEKWLNKLPADTGVFVDEGGLTLRDETGGYIEIGGEPSEEDEPLFHNFYRCYECKHEWEDEYPAQPDDDCPKCGARHCSPYKSEDVKP